MGRLAVLAFMLSFSVAQAQQTPPVASEEVNSPQPGSLSGNSKSSPSNWRRILNSLTRKGTPWHSCPSTREMKVWHSWHDHPPESQVPPHS